MSQIELERVSKEFVLRVRHGRLRRQRRLVRAVDERDPRVAIVDLEPAPPPRRIAIAWHRDRLRAHAAEAFVDYAAELCAELERYPLVAG